MECNARPARARGDAGATAHFEGLVAELSTRLANATSASIAAEIDAALQRLVDILGYDRCTYNEFRADGAASVAWSAAGEGVEPLPRGTYWPELQWFYGELRAGRIVALPDLPRGLPAKAAAEGEHVRRLGLRSHLSIPLRIGGRVASSLSFAGFRRAHDWPPDVIRRLTIIGELIASAVTRARLEEEAEQLRTRLWHADRVARTGALTAAIAHEINQPLAAILGNAQAGLAWMERGAADAAKTRAVLEAVVREVKRAAETIRSVRALLRHDESGRSRIDLAATIDEIVHLLGSTLRRRGIRVHASYRPDCFVMADRVQIEQLALNLILNAVDAMQAVARNGRELRVEILPVNERRVAARFSDTGPGIPPEHLATIFEPFWTTRKDGLGLGLAICRSIVQAHQGTIEARANAAGGATFVVELPLSPSATVPASAPENAGGVGPSATAGALVCIVDDDAAVREGLMRLLEASGCTAIAFGSGRELLERWPIPQVGCLLLDLRLPEISGIEIQSRLAALGPVPPVVFMSGHGDVASGVEAMKLGALDFLAKPVDPDTLVATLRRALSLDAAERPRAAERARCQGLLARLSPREREVTAHVIRGRLNKQIASDLGISEQTVKQHRGRVMEKLEVRSVADLVRVWEIAGSHPAPRPP